MNGSGSCWGQRTLKMDPPPGFFWARTLPPWAVAILATMDSPSPVPPSLVVLKGRKSFSAISGSMPGPLKSSESRRTGLGTLALRFMERAGAQPELSATESSSPTLFLKRVGQVYARQVGAQ